MRVADSITSFGGPRILLPADSAHLWHGASDQWDDPHGNREDHYALACDAGLLGTIEPYDVPLVVLGSDPGDLRYQAMADGHCFWVWIYGETEQDVRRLALEAFDANSWSESMRVELAGRYVTIDAAVPWADVQECLETHFEPGEWDVGFTYIERGETAAEVYSFRRASS